MRLFEAHISDKAKAFLRDKIRLFNTPMEANQILFDSTGIHDFFCSHEELLELKETILNETSLVEESDRAEFGDFQTNKELADKIFSHLSSKNISPDVIVEPTCGKGNFIIAALKKFSKMQAIYGIEIYKPYFWETKFEILNFFIENRYNEKPEIYISHSNVFDFDFNQISEVHSTKNILIVGNPPWVTNSMLSSLNSANLPEKSNFKNHSGLDAMTGKGNFDIAEYITLMILECFHKMNGHLVLLVKNSVIKNIVFDQHTNKYKISQLEKHCIDSKKEFNVSVEASMFFCKLNSTPEVVCSEYNFYSSQYLNQKFGWIGKKFVSHIENYLETKAIDGESQFEWRQGLKHDCSAIMELNKVNGHFVNGLNEEVELEDDLVFGILKSSDLKGYAINNTRKYTIVTQRKVGQDTKYIKSDFPKTYQYLNLHKSSFLARKSSIYRDKPLFSIFGIGDYSFKPYKVAISGLYKTFHFTLVLPQNHKPIMLDDTCYLLSFETLDFAAYATILLNSTIAKEFLQSITFSDAKRTFTKEVLMRIDFQKLANFFSLKEIDTEVSFLSKKYNLDISTSNWDNFLKFIAPITNVQFELFN